MDTDRTLSAPALGKAGQTPTGTEGSGPGLHWTIGLALLLACVASDHFFALFPQPRFGVQPWSLQPALALALVACGGARWALALAPALLLTWSLEPMARFDGDWLAAAAVLAFSYGWAGRALRRHSAWLTGAVQPRDVHVLLGLALICASVDALAEGARLFGSGGVPTGEFPVLAWRLFVASLLALAVWTPLVLVLLPRRSSEGRTLISGLRASNWQAWAPVLRDALLFVVTLSGLLVVVFAIQPLDEFRMSYLLFLPVLVVSMRHGLPGAALCVPLVQLGLLGTLAVAGSRAGTAFEYQMLVLTLAATSLYLGALSDERRRAAARIAQDERELRARAHALDEAQRIASTAELAAVLAHDLSQPLSAIGTYARASQLLAASGEARAGELADALQSIVAETSRAGQYLRRMREFFRTGTMRADRASVASLLDSTHVHLRDRLVRENVSWKTDIEPGLPPLRVDTVQTGAVLNNLVLNACDALAQAGSWRQIKVIARRAPADPSRGAPAVLILVEDSGPGVAPELRERLFKPLGTNKAHGMGLGLALSRSIAERQGGRLWYDAERQWTTFCLELPCDE